MVDAFDVVGEEALGAGGLFVFDFFAVFEDAEAVGLDDAEVHEDVLTLVIEDKAVAFFDVEPLHFSDHRESPEILRCLTISRQSV